MPSESPKTVKGSCLHCAGHFEFEEAAAGSLIACPHCGRETPLFGLSISFDLPPAAPAPTAAPPAAEPPGGAGSATDSDTGVARYSSGGAVHAGDRVHYRDGYATVVFVSNGEREECAPGYEDFRGHDAGIVLCDDDGETTYVREGDEGLVVVHH